MRSEVLIGDFDHGVAVRGWAFWLRLSGRFEPKAETCQDNFRWALSSVRVKMIQEKDRKLIKMHVFRS